MVDWWTHSSSTSSSEKCYKMVVSLSSATNGDVCRVQQVCMYVLYIFVFSTAACWSPSNERLMAPRCPPTDVA